jgi:membrane-associated HD superfamily phosphohydrolase
MRRTTSTPAPAPERFNIILGIAVTIALTALLCVHLLPNRTNLKLGETATSDVVAQRTVRYEDTELTARLRREAADAVDDVYVVQSDAAKQADEALQAVFSILETAGRDADKVIVNDVERATGLALSYKKVIEPLLSADRAQRAAALSVSTAVINRVMSTPIRDTRDDIAVAKRDSAAAMAIDTLPEPLRSPIRTLLQGLVTPNRILDRVETTRRRADAQSRIPRQYRRVAAGQAVIRSAERVTQAHLDAFSALGLRSRPSMPLPSQPSSSWSVAWFFWSAHMHDNMQGTSGRETTSKS